MKLDFGLDLNLQEYYNDLCKLIESLIAQRDSLAKAPGICTHPEKEWTSHKNGIISCLVCGTIISKGDFCRAANHL